jgi:HEAT repeat protein
MKRFLVTGAFLSIAFFLWSRDQGISADDKRSDHNEKSQRKLVDGLKDRRFTVRFKAREELRRIGAPAVPLILEILDDADWQVRDAAVEVLGQLEAAAKSALPALLLVLKSDPNSRVRAQAVAAVALISTATEGPRKRSSCGLQARVLLDSAVIASLLGATRDKSGLVRAYAAQSLSAIDGPNTDVVIATLITLLKDRSTIVIAESASSLGRMGLKAMPSLPVLGELLQHEDREIRVNAALAMWQIGRKADLAVSTLVKALKPEATVREQRLEDFLKPPDELHGDPRTQTVKDELLTHNRGRLKALEALATIGPDAITALPALIPLLKDRFLIVRIEAAKTIYELNSKSKEVIPVFIEGLEKSRYLASDRINSLIDTLARIGPDARAAVPVLTRMLSDEDAEVRMHAASALKHIATGTSSRGSDKEREHPL